MMLKDASILTGGHMDCTTTTILPDALIRKIATQFAGSLRELLASGDADALLTQHWMYPSHSCATHDLAAISLAMTVAFWSVVGRMPRLTSETDVAICGASWIRARSAVRHPSR